MELFKPKPEIVQCLLVPNDLFTESHHYAEENLAFETLRGYLNEVAAQLPPEYKAGFRLNCRVTRPESFIAEEIYDNLDHCFNVVWNDYDTNQIILGTKIIEKTYFKHRPFHLVAVNTTFTYPERYTSKIVMEAFSDRFEVFTDDQATFFKIIQRGKLFNRVRVVNSGRPALEEIMSS